MRRAAIIAVILGGLALPSAAAAAPVVSGEVFIKLPAGASNGGEQIEIDSFSWGDTRSGVKLEPVFVKSWSTSGSPGAPPPRAGGSNQMSMDDTAGKEKTRAGGFGEWIADVERPAEASKLPGKRTPPTVTLKRGSTRSTETTGGRAKSDMVMKGSKIGQNSTAGHHGRGIDIATVDGETVSPAGASRRAAGDPDQPIIAGNVPQRSSVPAGKGSVWIRVSSPWTACRVGTRYPTLELSGGGHSYLLQDVRVTSCGGASAAGGRPTEEVAFYYNRIDIR